MNKILKKIQENALSFPNKIALIGERKIADEIVEEKISYQDLVKKIDETTNFLRKSKYKNIALLADNSPDWIIFDLACLKAEITLTPIPHFFTNQQIENTLKEANIEAIFGDEILQNRFSNSVLNKVNESINYLLETDNEARIKDICKITFTSGSTADPKGIKLSANQIETVLFSLFERIGEENFEKSLSIIPLSILLENIAGVYLMLIAGATSVIPSLELVGIKNSSGIDIERFVKALAKHNPTSLITSPELAKLILNLTKAQKINPNNFKFIAIGGAKVAKEMLDEAHQLNLPIYQGYGLSENSSVTALNSKSQNKNGSVGKILSHAEVKIANDGEILIKGKTLAKDLKLDAEGYYATGDIGYFDEDGFLFISGRKKNIFITSMMRNVNPEWIESELLKSPIILQAAAFGEAMNSNLAIITLANPQISLEILKDEISKANQKLPDYAKISWIILNKESFSVQNLMLTGTGRIRREEISKNYEEQIAKRNFDLSIS